MEHSLRFSPFQIRLLLRVLLVLVVWRFLSTDYKAIALLIHGPNLYAPSPQWLYAIIDHLKHVLFSTAAQVVAIQAAGALLLLVAVVFPRRFLILMGLAPVLLVEMTAILYRYQMYNLDVAVALLLIAGLMPVGWSKVVGSDRRAHYEATLVGFALIAYVASAYFTAAYSKLTHDLYWVQNLHLENLPGYMIAKEGDTLPLICRVTGKATVVLFDWMPWLAALSSGLVLVAQLMYPAVLFERKSRKVIPAILFVFHIMFFLLVGTLFLEMAAIQICLFFLMNRESLQQREHPSGRFPARWSVANLAVAATSFLLVVLPSANQACAFPFVDYNQFGWSYQNLKGRSEYYCLGYRNAQTGEIEEIPANHWGFFDFRFSMSGAWVELYAKSIYHDQRKQQAPIIGQFLLALRPHCSNSFVLGPLAMPNHVVLQTKELPVETFREIHLLRRQVDPSLGLAPPVYKDLGKFPFSEESRAVLTLD